MFSNQNKQVTTKFQSARKYVTSQPSGMKTTSPQAMIPLRPTKTSTSLGLLSSTKPQLNNSSQIPKTATKAAPKFKFKPLDNNSSRMRAATLPRSFQPFATSRHIYRPAASKIFDYDLSKEETRNFRHCPKPMKSVPAEELQLLQSGQRATYLETRYERTPVAKYNYPEATSWRYGWFHRKNAIL